MTWCKICRKNTDYPVHRFPDPVKHLERFEAWVLAVGVRVENTDTGCIHRNWRLCSKHFEERFFNNFSRLSNISVPTLFLPQSCHTEELQSSPPGMEMEVDGSEWAGAGPAPMEVDVASTSASGTCVLLASTSETQTGPPTLVTSITTHLPSEHQLRDLFTIPASHQTSSQLLPKTRPKKASYCPNYSSNMVSRRTGRAPIVDEVVIAQRKVIVTLRRQINKMKLRNKNYRYRLAAATKLAQNESVNKILEKMTDPAKVFTQMQMRETAKRPKGRRFTLDEKCLALTLYKDSAKTYRLMCKLFILPTGRTLSRLLRRITIGTGINECIFRHLQTEVEKLPQQQRLCSLVFDEMAITPHLHYEEHKSEITGFEDFGKNQRTSKIADHVLVFMLRGAIRKYKQPVAYTFCTGGTKSAELQRQLKAVVQSVNATGLKIVATICDQGAANVAAINTLLNDTRAYYLRENKEYRGGIEIGGQKFVPLFDPPHLLKGIRNNLLTKYLKFKMNGTESLAKWEHLQQLYEADSHGLDGLRMMPKLTEFHVNPDKIPKMRVKYAAQVFSQQVAIHMHHMAGQDIPVEAKGTAQLLLFFDRLFDSLNSSYSKIRGGKMYRTAVTPTSLHLEFWNEAIVVLKTMKFLDKNKKEMVVPTLVNWVKTVEGFISICQTLKEDHGVTSLLTRHLNQDPLENFFGCIRRVGSRNVRPTCVGFEGAYKILMVNNLVSHHSVSANCQEDSSHCLQTVKFFLSADYVRPSEDVTIHFNENMLLDDSETNTPPTSQQTYVAGYVLKKCRERIIKSCQHCKADLVVPSHLRSHDYIRQREFAGKEWLSHPTPALAKCFTIIHKCTNMHLKNYVHKRHLKHRIEMCISSNVQFGFLTCGIHKIKLSDYIRDLSCRTLVHRFCKSVNEIIIGKSPNFDTSDPVKRDAFNIYTKSRARR